MHTPARDRSGRYAGRGVTLSSISTSRSPAMRNASHAPVSEGTTATPHHPWNAPRPEKRVVPAARSIPLHRRLTSRADLVGTREHVRWRKGGNLAWVSLVALARRGRSGVRRPSWLDGGRSVHIRSQTRSPCRAPFGRGGGHPRCRRVGPDRGGLSAAPKCPPPAKESPPGSRAVSYARGVPGPCSSSSAALEAPRAPAAKNLL